MRRPGLAVLTTVRPAAVLVTAPDPLLTVTVYPAASLAWALEMRYWLDVAPEMGLPPLVHW